MTMKKLVSIMVMISLIASCFTFSVVYASSAIVGESEFAQLSALGVMVGNDNGEAKLEDTMTRAEFAQVIKNLLTYKNGENDALASQWAQNFYGENTDHNELKVPTEEEVVTDYFTDVPSNHWAYETITYVRKMDIMRGTSATTFSPDGYIGTNEVVKTLMVLLGYKTVAEETGGYPTGYLNQAKKVKLLSGVNPGEYITRGEIAVLITNTLETNILTLTSIKNGEQYGFDKEGTFASMVMGLEKISGLMTDNGYSSLLAKSTYNGKYIVIEDTILEIAEGYDCSAFLGRNVDCWYKDASSDDPGEVVCVYPNGEDDFVEIDSENLEKTSLNEIYYKNEAGNLKKENVSGAYIIYNGVAINNYASDIFNITSGSIQICETDSSKYKKIVFVNQPETWYVSNVDTNDNIIYNSLKNAKHITENDIIRLDFEDPAYNITIYNEDGSLGSVSSIVKGSVLDVVRSGKVIKIYITQRVISDFKVNQMYEDYRGLVISDDSNEFVLTSAYENYELRDEIRLGDTLTLYLNRENRIAWAETQTNTTLNVAYMIRAGQDPSGGFDSTFAVKLYDLKGVIDTPVLAEKVTVSDSNGKVSQITAEEYYRLYGSYAGICRYAVNEDSEINYVEFPILDRDTNINGKLHLVLETDESTKTSAGYFVSTSINSFGGKALLNTNSKVICRNPHVTDEDKAFSLATYTIFGEKTNNIVKLYTDVQGSPVGKYVVFETSNVASNLGELNEGFVVKKVVKGVHPDEDSGDIIKAVRFKFRDTVREEDLYLEDGVIENIETEAQTKVNGVITYPKWDGTLEPGDIIRVAKDSDGMVTKIRIVWDENGTDDGSTTPGSMPGMADYFHTASFHTNPWAISWAADSSLYDASGFSAGIMRVYNGFPYNLRDGAVRLTTYDLPANGYLNVDEDKYLNEVWNIARIVVVDLSRYGKVTVKNGTAADIKTYEDYGPDCSRIVTFSRAGTIDTTLVINGYYEG